MPTIPRQRLGLIVLVLLWTLTWALSHGYKGIFHDATLYTLQALARLHPASLSRDVFLRFGSQDRYTVFSPLYAAMMHWIGTEPAAAVLTLTLQLAFLLGAAHLARVAVGTPLALLGVSLLIAIPGAYGSDAIFTCIEPFITPRMGAEALVFGSLAAALGGRAKLACALLFAAVLLHPIMAGAGLAALLCLYVAIPRPRLAALLIGAALLLLIVGALTVGSGPFARFDTTWLALLQERSPYLFLERWTLDDWGRTTVSLATLALGAVTLAPGRPRKLAQVGLITALGGLALTLVACDWLQLVLFTQLQPWRCQWLATAVAALLLPAIATACWKDEHAGRPATLLLVSAWVFATGPFALATALAALIGLALLPRLGRSEGRLIFYGTCAVLALALALRIASNLLFLDAFYSDPSTPVWIRKTASFVHDGCASFAIMLLATLLASRRRGSPVLILLGMATAAACVALAPETWSKWSQRQYPPALVADFAPWRALIPPGTDVFWSESPVATWVLLERPSYLSVIQTSGMVFSHSSALELQRRALALSAVAPPSGYLELAGTGAGLGPSKEQMERACTTAEFEYLVTSARLSWTPLAEVPAAVWHSSGGLRLYRCADRRT